jgi:hypothetical protein
MKGVIADIDTRHGFVIIFQIAKASEYVSVLKGEDKSNKREQTRSMLLC